MTKEEKRHLSKVAEIGCMICFNNGYPQSPCEIHHARGIGLGMGVRNSHYNVIGLCPAHHRGNEGYHGMGRKAFERKYNTTEQELLDQVRSLLNGNNDN